MHPDWVLTTAPILIHWVPIFWSKTALAEVNKVLKYQVTQELCHKVFMDAVGGEPDFVNYSEYAARIGCAISTLWRYCNGKSKWPVGVWFSMMRELENQGRPVDYSPIFKSSPLRK